MLVIGPTLLDLAHHVSVGIGTVSLMFTCRGVGAGIGGIISGVALDKFNGYSYTIISVILISFIGSE